MINKSIIAQTISDYGESLAVIEYYVSTTRDMVTECEKNSIFPNRVIEAVCISKFVGTNFGVDTISVLRKVLGARALLEESQMGNDTFVCNAACIAEGDNAIMELKVVGDLLVKRGFSAIFPVSLMTYAFFINATYRRLIFWYIYFGLKALWLQKRALNDGQLLKDIAWCRAHLCIISSFSAGATARYDAKHVGAMLASYERLLVRIPTPAQF